MSPSLAIRRGIGTLADIPPRLLRNPVHLLALGFGSGLAPKAPGTAGTLAAILPYILLVQLPLPIYCALTALAFIAGIYICEYTGKALGVHDHGGIVWDEFVGFWVTMIAVPFAWQWILLGFVLFRLFDIVKPWPVKVADRRLKGGFGVMFDDLLAGIYAWCSLQLLIITIAD